MWRQGPWMLSLLVVFITSMMREAHGTDMPVVGVLTQETHAIQNLFPNHRYKSYIAASYVKFLESSGARVIPIWIGRDSEYYKKIVATTNGIFLPGGAVFLNNSTGGFADAGQMLYKAALDINKSGTYYPVWGTCLGMEMLIQAALNGLDIRVGCVGKGIGLPLDFVDDFKSSKLFGGASSHVLNIFRTQNVTVNYHRYCITRHSMLQSNLDKEWRVLSTNRDSIGLEFVSSYEHREFPIYGVQFHPEKNPFEFKLGQVRYVLHTKDAIVASQYFGNFFVEETRKNNHHFNDRHEEQKKLIYNYSPQFTGVLGGMYEQVYVFTKEQNNS